MGVNPNRISSSGRRGPDWFRLDQRLRSIRPEGAHTVLNCNPNCNPAQSGTMHLAPGPVLGPGQPDSRPASGLELHGVPVLSAAGHRTRGRRLVACGDIIVLALVADAIAAQAKGEGKARDAEDGRERPPPGAPDSVCPLNADCWSRRMLSRETVLAVPQVRVSARWISCSRAASIEMQVTGVAGTAGHRRHPDACTG
jgi:hypothetical protein